MNFVGVKRFNPDTRLSASELYVLVSPCRSQPSSMILSAVVSVLVVALTWFTWATTRARLAYDLHKIPGPTPWPIVGNLNKVAGSSYLHKILAGWSEQYGPIYRWRLGLKDILVITDPVEVLKLCSKEANQPKFALAYKLLNPRWPHTNLVTTPDYEEWRYVRKTLNPAFSPDSIRKTFPKIYQAAVQAADALSALSRQGVVEMNNFSKRITADVMNGFAFEEDPGFLDLAKGPDGQLSFVPKPYLEATNSFYDSVAMVFHNPLYAIFLALCPWHPHARALKQAKATCEETEDLKVANIRKQGKQPESNTRVWACLSRLVHYRDGSELCSDAIAAQVAIIFAAGFESTAHAITWALFELAAHQQLQDHVRTELREAGLTVDAHTQQFSTKPLEYSDLSKLPWVDAVARETLRLHPSAPLGSEREAKEDMVVMGYRVPKGTPFMLTPYAAHVSPSNFLQPYKFAPERWLTSAEAEHIENKGYPDATAKGNRRAVGASWNPFSCGPRNCIGQRLAMAELRSVLAVLLSRFRFELPEGIQRDKFLETEQVAWVTLQPKEGLPLKVTPLASQQTPSTATESPVTPPETPSLSIKTPLTPSDAESANGAD